MTGRARTLAPVSQRRPCGLFWLAQCQAVEVLVLNDLANAPSGIIVLGSETGVVSQNAMLVPFEASDLVLFQSNPAKRMWVTAELGGFAENRQMCRFAAVPGKRLVQRNCLKLAV